MVRQGTKVSPVRSKQLVRQFRRQLSAWLFLAPALIILGLFLFYPAAMAFWMSFHDWKSLGGHTWIGLKNYHRLLTFPYFLDSVRNTLYFTLLNVSGTMIISLVIALLLDADIRGRHWFRLCFYLPVVTSGAAVSLLWKWILQGGELGILNHLVSLVGLPMQDWLGNPRWAMPAIVVVNIWKHTGYYALIFLAGLQAISPEFYEVARVDGANRWQLVRHITIPLIRPYTTVVAVIATIGALKVFGEVYVMTGGAPGQATYVLNYYIYQLGFRFWKMGYASTVGVVLLLMVLVFSVLNLRVFEEREPVL